MVTRGYSRVKCSNSIVSKYFLIFYILKKSFLSYFYFRLLKNFVRITFILQYYDYKFLLFLKYYLYNTD